MDAETYERMARLAKSLRVAIQDELWLARDKGSEVAVIDEILTNVISDAQELASIAASATSGQPETRRGA
ncbi:MAG TPA: hypothetical protein VIK52_01210 [Opitutaceae bacterium]